MGYAEQSCIQPMSLSICDVPCLVEFHLAGKLLSKQTKDKYSSRSVLKPLSSTKRANYSVNNCTENLQTVFYYFIYLLFIPHVVPGVRVGSL